MLRYCFVEPGAELVIPVSMKAFRCLILIERDVSASDRNAISHRLVDAGCLYAMAWGTDCSLWDDSIDEANIEEFLPGGIPDDRFVITTSHNTDTLGDVIFFAKFNSIIGYNDQVLEELLVLDLGFEYREAQIRHIYNQCDLSSPP